MIRVELANGNGLNAPLSLLENFLREGEPLSPEFLDGLRASVERGDYEVLVAYKDADEAGATILSYRLSVSARDTFASIEELYVKPDARRRGVGGALLEAVGERCAAREVSYVEVQTAEEDARSFYAAAGYAMEEDVRVMSRSYPL